MIQKRAAPFGAALFYVHLLCPLCCTRKQKARASMGKAALARFS